MPQSNNAELTEIFTSETGVNVQSNQPNADNKAPTYDVRLRRLPATPSVTAAAITRCGSTASTRAWRSATAP